MPRDLLAAPAPLRPFDPTQDQPRQNSDGSVSTEVTRTVPMGNDQWANVPSIWWDKQGSHDMGQMNDDQLAQYAAQYEAQTGKQFPRFGDLKTAEQAAVARSAAGGGEHGSITAPPPLTEAEFNNRWPGEIPQPPAARDLLAAPPSTAEDIAKTVPGAAATGLWNMLTWQSGLADLGAKGITGAADLALSKIAPETFANLQDKRARSVATRKLQQFDLEKHHPWTRFLDIPTPMDVGDSIASMEHQPETTGGKYAQTLAHFVPAAFAGGPPGNVAGAIIRQGVAPAVVSEAAGEFAKDIDPSLEPWARLAGSFAGLGRPSAGGADATNDVMAALRQKAAKVYRDVDATGYVVQPAQINNLLGQMHKKIMTPSQKFTPEHNPEVVQQFQILSRALGDGRPHTLSEVDAYRSGLGQAAYKAVVGSKSPMATVTPNTARLLGDMKNTMGNWMEILPGGQELIPARRMTRTLKTAEAVDNVIKEATAKTSSGQSSMEVNLRTGFRQLMTNKRRGFQYFTPVEKAAIKDAAGGGPIRKTMRTLADGLAQRTVGSGALAAGGASLGLHYGGPTAGAAGGLLGYLAGTIGGAGARGYLGRISEEDARRAIQTIIRGRPVPGGTTFGPRAARAVLQNKVNQYGN